MAPSLEGMGDDTFRCPQCQRELPYANDTYNPETQTCRACGRGETSTRHLGVSPRAAGPAGLRLGVVGVICVR